MKICLATRHANASFMPLALLYLKASLVEHGGVDAADVTIAEFDRKASGETIAGVVLATEPDVVGFSCYVWNVVALLDAARRIRLARPQTRIVLGGPEVGPLASAVLERHAWIDVIVRSEGEVPIRDLVRCWRDQGQMAGVLGISYRDGERVVATAEAPIVRDLNRVASPHLANYIDHANRTICLETQRGCVFTCNFCFYNKDYSIRNRRFDLDAREGGTPVLAGAGRVRDLPDGPGVQPQRRARQGDLPLHRRAQRSPDSDPQRDLGGIRRRRDGGAVARANFTFIEVGLQTSDHAVLELVERRFKRQQFLEGIGFLKTHQLGFELQLIAGLPGETLETFRTSLNFAASLAPPHLSVFDLMILPGTELWRKADSMGIAFDPEPPYEVRSHATMSAADIARVRDIANMSTRLWDSQTLRLLGRAAGAAYADLVDDWLAWNGGPSTREELRERLVAFVTHHCATRQIPEQFFLASAAVELRDGAVPPATAESGRS